WGYWDQCAEVMLPFRVRCPVYLHSQLRFHGLPYPRISATVPKEGRWLWKPLASAGGHGIRFAETGETAPSRLGPSCYLQEFLDGDSYAAIFLGHGATAHLLGITRQLIGEPWLHALPFSYCGSIGPVDLPSVRPALERIGAALARDFAMDGLFGVDFILH